MSDSDKHGNFWRLQFHAALVVARKDVMIYYFKAPVLIFGVIFPFFIFLAFAIGRNIPAEAMVAGLIAMALFFTASAVGPLVTPWERQARTYERLVTSPASLEAILAGDVLSGVGFGTGFSLVPIILGIVASSASIAAPAELFTGVILGAASFASLGVLLAAPVTQSPSQVMMLSNLVRLPIIFISGVFVPIREMPTWGRWLAPLSPLSYCTDLIRSSFGKAHYFPIWVDVAALAGFAAAFFALARWGHRRSRFKAL